MEEGGDEGGLVGVEGGVGRGREGDEADLWRH